MLMLRLAEPSSWNGHFTIDCVPRNETPGNRFSKYFRIASGWKDVIASLSSRTSSSLDQRRSLGFPSSASSKGPCGTLGTCTFCTSQKLDPSISVRRAILPNQRRPGKRAVQNLPSFSANVFDGHVRHLVGETHAAGPTSAHRFHDFGKVPSEQVAANHNRFSITSACVTIP